VSCQVFLLSNLRCAVPRPQQTTNLYLRFFPPFPYLLHTLYLTCSTKSRKVSSVPRKLFLIRVENEASSTAQEMRCQMQCEIGRRKQPPSHPNDSTLFPFNLSPITKKILLEYVSRCLGHIEWGCNLPAILYTTHTPLLTKCLTRHWFGLIYPHQAKPLIESWRLCEQTRHVRREV